MKRLFIFNIIFIWVLVNAIYGQQELSLDYFEDKNSKSILFINAEYLSLGATYQRQIKNKWFWGLRATGGLGYRYVLGKTIREFDYESGTYHHGHNSNLYEMIKLDFNFSKYYSVHFYNSLGPYISLIAPNENLYFSYGLSYGIHYGSRKLKMGHVMQAGLVFLKVSGHPEYNKNVFYIGITPILLSFSF